MAGINNQNPLLRTEYIQGVVDAYVPQPGRYLFQQYFPKQNVNTTTIKWDEKSPLNYGLTKPSVPGAESPIIKGGHMKQYSVIPPHFREKYVFRRDEAVSIRRYGTSEQLMDPQQLISERVNWLLGRVDDRFEWMCARALQGGIVIRENNINEIWNYSLPAHMNVTLTGGDRWNQPASAQPLRDIMNMVNLSRGYGWRFTLMLMNSATANTALQITEFRNFFRDAMQGGILQGANIASMDTLQKILQLHIPDVPAIKVWDEGYYIEVPLVGDAPQSASAVEVDEAIGLAAGDQVTIVHASDRHTQLMTLSTDPQDVLNSNTKLLNFATTLSQAYPTGSVVRAHKRHIPDGRVIFLPDQGRIGTFFLTPTEWAPGSLTNPKPGRFFEQQVHEDEDPKRIEYITGFEGIAVPQYLGMHAILNTY